MKKIILSVSLILAFIVSAGAQPHHRPRPYQDYYNYSNIGEVRLHITGELGIADLPAFFWHRAPRHYSIGILGEIQVGRRLSLGLGADFFGTRINDQTYPAYFNSVPVYGNIKFSSPGYGTKVFVEARVGYAIPVNIVSAGYPTSYYETRGLFTGGGIGLNCFNSNISIGINAIDVTYHNGFVPLNESPGRSRVITNFYLRYSYAIPLN
jgi:hypothetical protein